MIQKPKGTYDVYGKKSKQIKLLDRYTDPVSRIVDKIFTINFDTTKEKFLKYFNLKE